MSPVENDGNGPIGYAVTGAGATVEATGAFAAGFRAFGFGVAFVATGAFFFATAF